MMKKLLLSLALLATSLAFGATFVVESNAGCKVEVRSTHDGEDFLWSGKCKDGKANGNGTLTSSHGAFLQGEFQAGEVADASGRWPFDLRGGRLLLMTSRYSKTAQYISRPLLPDDHQKLLAVVSEPLVGEWRLEAIDGSCRELHSYQRGGISTVESGQERVKEAYALLRSSHEPMAYALLSTVISTNRSPDCQGSMAVVGTTRIQGLVLVDRNEMLLCDLTDRSKCLAKLVRTNQ
jgi:hypothetical protein